METLSPLHVRKAACSANHIKGCYRNKAGELLALVPLETLTMLHTALLQCADQLDQDVLVIRRLRRTRLHAESLAEAYSAAVEAFIA